MFSHDQLSGRAVCLEDYGRLKKGAVVPESNELWADVEAWKAEGNELLAFDGYPEIPPTEDEIQAWRDNAAVSAFQAEQALDDFGLLEAVEAWIEQKADDKARRAWRLAKEWRYNSPTISDACDALEITLEQKDALFRHAEGIEA